MKPLKFLLGPTLANIFLCYHESNWLKDCPKNFKPIYYKGYVDDIFVLFNKPELNRCFNLSSGFLKFHHEVDKLEKVL